MKKSNQDSITLKSLASLSYAKTATPLIFGLLGLALGFCALGYLMFTRSEPKIVPYIVTVDRQGSVLSSDILKPQKNIPESAIAAFMCDFTEKLYSVFEDKSLQREYIREIYSMIDLESQARSQLDSFYNEANLFSKDLNLRQSVKIESVSRISESSFQVDYTIVRTSFDDESERSFKSIFSYRIASLNFDTVEQLRLNPLSILIYEIKTSRKIVKEHKNA